MGQCYQSSLLYQFDFYNLVSTSLYIYNSYISIYTKRLIAASLIVNVLRGRLTVLLEQNLYENYFSLTKCKSPHRFW